MILRNFPQLVGYVQKTVDYDGEFMEILIADEDDNFHIVFSSTVGTYARIIITDKVTAELIYQDSETRKMVSETIIDEILRFQIPIKETDPLG